ncbi:hypothetical protein [Flavobacterium sp. ABG]|uniref:hypothetical protein n=1 Tax=Flavobacterium sp. ABG TaxID=1423322 RepID=UPI000649B0DE|nr:hypothetical protein [Flavobacterium sp. ABG]KLT69025.1 hypothetical protein AB674_14455 [Flavobacterium sp. ABG]
MTTSNISEVETRLTDFFANKIDPKDMAKTIRRFNYLIALSVMEESEVFPFEKTSLKDDFYWLNELTEVLDPYLEIE